MRITRNHENRDERPRPVVPTNAATVAFTTALRGFQERERANADPAQPQQRSQRGSRTDAVRTAKALGETSETLPTGAMLTGPTALSSFVHERTMTFDIPAVVAATLVLRPLRRPGREASDETRCFEVEDSKSGARFLVSHQDGVWQLTLPSGSMEVAHRDELVSTLRQMFADRGLGPIDVIA